MQAQTVQLAIVLSSFLKALSCICVLSAWALHPASLRIPGQCMLPLATTDDVDGTQHSGLCVPSCA